jgi:hypothetical protein
MKARFPTERAGCGCCVLIAQTEVCDMYWCESKRQVKRYSGPEDSGHFHVDSLYQAIHYQARIAKGYAAAVAALVREGVISKNHADRALCGVDQKGEPG